MLRRWLERRGVTLWVRGVLVRWDEVRKFACRGSSVVYGGRGRSKYGRVETCGPQSAGLVTPELQVLLVSLSTHSIVSRLLFPFWTSSSCLGLRGVICTWRGPRYFRLLLC